jgi:hypothetical protein
VPEGFGAVRQIVPAGENRVAITEESGAEILVPVDWRFPI